MSGYENIYKPSADAAREKTLAAIKSAKQDGKNPGDKIKKAGVSADCNAVNNMDSVENPINNASPNATNISR